ncbi:MAG: hypothetical protein K6D97_08690 [Clostridia bacterium]|nr:hypothetical protein [Clostridia bacterium]
MADEKIIKYIFAMKQCEIEQLENKKQKILFESCPCCKGLGVMYAMKKGKSLRIWCSYKGEILEEKRYYEK